MYRCVPFYSSKFRLASNIDISKICFLIFSFERVNIIKGGNLFSSKFPANYLYIINFRPHGTSNIIYYH